MAPTCASWPSFNCFHQTPKSLFGVRMWVLKVGQVQFPDERNGMLARTFCLDLLSCSFAFSIEPFLLFSELVLTCLGSICDILQRLLSSSFLPLGADPRQLKTPTPTFVVIKSSFLISAWYISNWRRTAPPSVFALLSWKRRQHTGSLFSAFYLRRQHDVAAIFQKQEGSWLLQKYAGRNDLGRNVRIRFWPRWLCRDMSRRGSTTKSSAT